MYILDRIARQAAKGGLRGPLGTRGPRQGPRASKMVPRPSIRSGPPSIRRPASEYARAPCAQYMCPQHDKSRFRAEIDPDEIDYDILRLGCATIETKWKQRESITYRIYAYLKNRLTRSRLLGPQIHILSELGP